MRLVYAFLLSSLLLTGTACAETSISPSEAARYIADTRDLVLLDVRNPEELADGQYPGALNIPIRELEARIAEVPTDKPVLIYCARGVRAERAYRLLAAARPQTHLAFIKGTPDWKR